LNPVRVGEDAVEQHRLDLALETEAIKRLNAGIALCRDKGDNGSRELLVHILTGEEDRRPSGSRRSSTSWTKSAKSVSRRADPRLIRFHRRSGATAHPCPTSSSAIARRPSRRRSSPSRTPRCSSEIRKLQRKGVARGAARAQLRHPRCELIDKLVELGVDAESWTALSLVPLVEVAWADGKLEAGERKAILAAAADGASRPGSPSQALLDGWLAERPQSALFASWGAYATGLATSLGGAERAELRRAILERARKVARAAGGLLGIAAVSDAEKRVIARSRSLSLRRYPTSIVASRS